MAQIESQSMPREKFLTIAVNLLHKTLLESQRTSAKGIFRALADGKRVALTNVQMEDRSTVRFDVTLDHSEYAGTLNFSAFRASLTVLVANLATAVREQRDISTFSAQGKESEVMFGVTGVTLDHGVPAVMVLGADLGGQDATVLLKLMYLDYQQFQRASAAQA